MRVLAYDHTVMHCLLPGLLGLVKDSQWFQWSMVNCITYFYIIVWELSEIINVKVIACSFPVIKMKTKHQFSLATTSVIYLITDLIYSLRGYYTRLISAFIT